jgi:signal transduction histidine kinase/ActR/RegA family two-component response regulator
MLSLARTSAPATRPDPTLFELANVGLWIGDLSALARRVDDWRARGVSDVRAWLADHPNELPAVVAEMRMLDCNACAVELCEGDDVPTTLTGYPALFVPESYDALYEELQAILERRERFEFHAVIRTLRGRRREVRIGVRFPREADGWQRVVVTMLDVTESRRVERALRDGEERFKLATRAVHGHIYDVDLPSGRVWRSDGLLGLVGFAPEDVPPTTDWWSARIHPADVGASVEHGLAATRDGDSSYSTRYRVRHRDGHWVRVWDRVLIVRDDAGRVRRIVGNVTDVTAEEQAYLALRESQAALEAAEERSRLALDAARLGTFDFDVQHGTLHWDARSRELFGLAGTDAPTYEQFVAGIHPDDRAHVLSVVEAAARSADRTRYEAEFRYLAGSAMRWIRAYGRIAYEQDAAARVTGTVQDVTAQREAADRLRALAEHLREADRRKDEFLATLAHELRNPLAPVRSAAKLLAVPGIGARELAWSRDVIGRQVQHMARLLDDLLDVSRITRGRLELRRTRVTLAAVVDAAVETARPLLDARRHVLRVSLPPDPIEFDADPVRLAQVFANLLTNAAKYTDEGGHVALVAHATADAVEITVRDDGIGLAPAALDHVFEMFSQVTSALHRSEGGLGIGLALVRGLVELHGGRVGARSPGIGLGSEFVVTLPRRAAGAAAEASVVGGAPEASATPRRVLVADDNRDAAEGLALLLRHAGHDVRVAHDGRTALETATTFHPDAVLLDIGMPTLNGYEVAARLRAEPWARGAVLIAVTGWGQEEDKRLASCAGFDHHLTKPVDPDAIVAILRANARSAG